MEQGETTSITTKSLSVRFPLRWKLSVGACLLAVVPLALGGALAFSRTKRAVRDGSISLQLSVADDVARTVTNEVRPVLTVLRSVAGPLADKALSESERLAVAAYAVSSSDALASVAVYDEHGDHIDTLAVKGAVAEPFSKTLLEGARSACEDRESAVVAAEGADGTKLLALVPILNNSADPPTVTGYVAGFVPRRAIEQRINRLVGETLFDRIDSVFVGDLEGRILFEGHSSHLQSQPAEPFLRNADLQALSHELIKAEPFTSTNGIAMFGAVVARPEHRWAVAVQTRQEKAFAALSEARQAILVGLLLAALAALVLALLWSRRLTRPMNALVDQVRRLAQRDFAHRAKVNTSDELALLSDALNTAAGDLQASEDLLVEETQVRHDLSRYIPQEVVDAVVRKEHDMSLGGNRREITVVFADVVAFTSMTERLAPEATVALLNELFTILTEIVFKHGGTVDKFIGDSVMAIFGAPLDSAHHAEDAVACAEDMLTWLEAGNDKWVAKHNTRVELAIGVHTGEAVVGNIGSESRMEYTAIGSTVNIAARLEAVARPQQILVSSATKQACPDHSFTSVGEQRLIRDHEAFEVFALDC